MSRRSVRPEVDAEVTPYQITTPTFEGPLDLLLQLVERHQLDITTVSLALVTDQYVEHLRSGVGIDSEQLSEFIAVAAKLLHIKSIALLPRPASPNASVPAEDPTDLTERLREYERIKRGALTLRQREESDLRSYPHAAPADPRSWLERVRAESDRQLSFVDEPREVQRPAGLAVAFRRVANRRRDDPTPVAREKWTVADAVVWLMGGLRAGASASFRRLVGAFDRHRVVGAFLAILELHRQGRLRARQAEPFGDITVEPLEPLAESEPLVVTSEAVAVTA